MDLNERLLEVQYYSTQKHILKNVDSGKSVGGATL